MALSYEADIRPMFRNRDVESMKQFGSFDLSRFEHVRIHASRIYSRLASKTMPCDDPWSEDQIARFKDWMDGGMAP
ncbi:MAG: hypothetical protein ABR606_05655 [Vicinamibacterales bacterium]